MWLKVSTLLLAFLVTLVVGIGLSAPSLGGATVYAAQPFKLLPVPPDPIRKINPIARVQVKSAAQHLRGYAAAWAQRLKDLESRKEHDDEEYRDGPGFLWYLDFRDVPEARLDDTVAFTQWWLNQMSFARAVGYLQRVNARLYYVNILDFRWNQKARDIVGAREPYTDAAWCDEEDVVYLQKTLEIEQDAALARQNRFPTVGVVRATWLLRETLESARNGSYYDLLYARQRYGGITRRAGVGNSQKTEFVRPPTVLVESLAGRLVEVRPEQVRPGEKAYTRVPGSNVLREYRPGAEPTYSSTSRDDYKVDSTAKERTGANFPADLKDWNDAYGIDIVKDFANQRKIDVTYGSITPGSNSDEVKGSIVALNDRLVFTIPNGYGFVSMRTFDFLETTGRKDLLERSPDVPFDAEKDNLNEDAGEHLNYLPNGGQAALLTNGQKKRVEAADPQAAQNSLGKKHRATVRNPGDCIECHAPDGGYILPHNLITQMREAGVDLSIKKHRKFEKFKAFYENWEENVEPYRRAYLRLAGLATRNPLKPGDKGWTGPVLAKKYQEFMGWYDAPLKAETVAIDTGYETGLVKQAAADAAIEKGPDGEFKNARARLSNLAQGIPMARRTYEVDVHRQLQLQFVKGRLKP